MDVGPLHQVAQRATATLPASRARISRGRQALAIVASEQAHALRLRLCPGDTARRGATEQRRAGAAGSSDCVNRRPRARGRSKLFGEVSADVPELVQRAGCDERTRRVQRQSAQSSAARRLSCSASSRSSHSSTVRPAQLRLRAFGKREEVGEVAAPRRVRTTGIDQLLSAAYWRIVSSRR